MGECAFSLDSGAELLKVGPDLGLVFGFAAICTEDGKPFFDAGSAGAPGIAEHLPEDVMLKMASDFMLNSRVSSDEHSRDAAGKVVPDGTVVFMLPLTAELAKRLNITTKRTGLIVGMKPSPEVLAKFKDGYRHGFSIGGQYVEVEEVPA